MIVTTFQDFLFLGKQISQLFLSCRETEYRELMSQSFPVSCFQLCGLVPHRKWYFTSLACQDTEEKN